MENMQTNSSSDSIVATLIIHTNLKQYEPYGRGTLLANPRNFTSPIGRVVGFFGSHGNFLQSVGVYHTTSATSKQKVDHLVRLTGMSWKSSWVCLNLCMWITFWVARLRPRFSGVVMPLWGSTTTKWIINLNSGACMPLLGG
ncbi:hypothetical protein RND81_06G023400 [Saponaria officinalis]|uniref:Jacalin-type lectin domain-containing protein n=1 Tax=Saponaria officinalis TaxID=3572 RepID=A0AAW1K674_SAPOF